MTLVVSIPSKDRIVVAADGKALDTKKGILNVPKIFELNDNCTVMFAGELLNDMDELVKTLKFNVSDKHITGVRAVAKHVQEFTKLRTWAATAKSHLIAVISGYEREEPFTFVRLSTGELEEIQIKSYVQANWDDAIKTLVDDLGGRLYPKISFRTAEKLAVVLLHGGEKANPKDIGGQGMLWHVRPHKIEKKSSTYLSKLQHKHLVVKG